MRARVTRVLVFFLLPLLCWAEADRGEEAPRFWEAVQVLAKSVFIRASGPQLSVDDLEVLVDGIPARILEVLPLSAAETSPFGLRETRGSLAK